ncbi:MULTISPECIES: orange carotenoid protein N-terminal domain-containing protein [Microcoleaceae]|uniref:orange carotenoid protein N-terminal domain-containing protein n=1 Tax=Microcoleaceae TaxID=1892252 RepID=UPI00187EBA26|nr:orange carotenoid protein N-terminal domain-containing protein [Tychonema sp. LEGE 06208]MBE9165000.1 Orange carotenoid protein [Tychonema sp. LEGE 06208]
MTFSTTSAYDQGKADMQSLNVDDQLGLLWFVYTEMGKSITPAAPGAAGSEIAEGLFEQVKALPKEEQLQVMRDIASKTNTEISRMYGSLSPETKLAFWYFLAVGMDEGTIIPVPSDYKLPEAGNALLAKIKGMDFQQQIDFLRGTVLEMGAEAASGAGI